MKFTLVKRGYDTTEVDKRIEALEAELSAHKDSASAVSKAIISAESAAAKIIEDAQAKASKIIEAARSEVYEELNAVEKMLSHERKALNDFCSDFDTVVKSYFTGTAAEITQPLREKIDLIEQIVKEARGSAEPSEASEAGAGGVEGFF